MAWGGQAERKEEEKRKKEEAPRLESLMARKTLKQKWVNLARDQSWSTFTILA